MSKKEHVCGPSPSISMEPDIAAECINWIRQNLRDCQDFLTKEYKSFISFWVTAQGTSTCRYRICQILNIPLLFKGKVEFWYRWKITCKFSHSLFVCLEEHQGRNVPWKVLLFECTHIWITTRISRQVWIDSCHLCVYSPTYTFLCEMHCKN